MNDLEELKEELRQLAASKDAFEKQVEEFCERHKVPYQISGIQGYTPENVREDWGTLVSKHGLWDLAGDPWGDDGDFGWWEHSTC